MIKLLWAGMALVLTANTSFSQVFDEKFDHWPVDLKINGRVIVAGNLKDPLVIQGLLDQQSTSGPVCILTDSIYQKSKVADIKRIFRKSDDIKVKMSKRFDAEALKDVWQGRQVVVLAGSTLLTKKEKESVLESKPLFIEFIKRGGTLVTIGTLSEMVASDESSLQLLPDVELETSYSEESDRSSLLATLNLRPKAIGVGLESDTALVLAGRKMWVAGAGGATFLIKGNQRSEPRSHTIRPFNSRAQTAEQVMLDLTQWRRDAIDRTLPEFPSKQPRTPSVENGTLIIVGGGRNPRGLSKQMIDLAGGVDEARLVYIPCSESDNVGEQHQLVEAWKKMGVKHATFIHTKDRTKANSDDEFLAPLKEATCIYFGGGRQWNFADSYYGTKAHQMMKDVLKRGGVIAGSSAGASIQARYLARATPINNVKIMAFGYERGGLGFLDGVAIDQHFSQRQRQADMSRLVATHPQLLGIGIDEQTAIIVQKSQAQVVGAGQVYFYDGPNYRALKAGARFDLAKRQVLPDKK